MHAAKGLPPGLPQKQQVPSWDDLERRWCPDTWRWYTLQDLRSQFRGKFGEEQINEHWAWVMQREPRALGLDGHAQSSPSRAACRSLPVLQLPHGAVEFTRDGGGSECGRYLLFRPPGLDDCGGEWPVLVFLHGHREIDRPEDVASFLSGRARILDVFALENFIVVAPLAETGGALLDDTGHSFCIESVLTVVQTACARLSPQVDRGRICVTGFSMGADAGAQLAWKYGEQFSAFALFAGSYNLSLREPFAGASAAVRCFHNEADGYVSVDRTKIFLEQLGERCGCKAPAVRHISVLYPSDCLSIESLIKDVGMREAYLQIRIAEYPGHGKSSWILKDAEHTGYMGHMCWPVIYSNESVFGLFHWLLTCSKSSIPRPSLRLRPSLDSDRAGQVLEALKAAYSSDALKRRLASLAARLPDDGFTFFAHSQRLVFEVQRKVLKSFGFKQSAEGLADMNAALAENLGPSSAQQSSFQKTWDEIRRLPYGRRYHECWLPSMECGDATVRPLPRDAVAIARGRSAPFAVEEALKMQSDLKRDLVAERSRLRELDKPARRIPYIHDDDAMNMQEDLCDAFAMAPFQERLAALRHEHQASPLKFTLARAELVFEVQRRVLPRYGFEASRLGVADMLAALHKLEYDDRFCSMSDECNYLLGLEHRFLTSPEGRKRTQIAAEERKAWHCCHPRGLMQ